MSKYGKLKKLLTRPKAFFRDSVWFSESKIEQMGNYKNLFIISHLGQLHQIESFIKYENVTDNLLVILYTNKNLKMPKLVRASADKKLFSKTYLFLLPNSPNSNRLKPLFAMNKDYKALIDYIKPQNLYMQSFENHYALLSSYAKSKDIHITLLDEGTASYKTQDLSEYYKSTSFLKKTFAKLLGIDSAFEWFTEYDNIYAAFPELLKKTFYAKNYHRFFSHALDAKVHDKTKALIQEYNITSDDFIYVNQRYAVSDQDFTNAILKILNTFAEYFNAKVFIKLHPKDTNSIKNSFNKNLANYKNLIMIKENEFLIEPTVMEVKPRGVVGLTSTALVYAPLVSEKTKVFSIAKWFLSLIPADKNEKGIEIIKAHHTILGQFKHVLNLSSENDLKLDKLFESDFCNDSDKYLTIARDAYADAKPIKAIVNYKWAYPQGITTMSLDNFVKYVECMYKMNGLRDTHGVLREWVEAEIQRDKNEELSYYRSLIETVVTILDRSLEFIYQIEIDRIYHDILALITTTLQKKECPVSLISEEIYLLEKYEENLLSFIALKAKKYMLDNRYEDAKELFNKINDYETYITKHEDLNIYLLECLIQLDEKELVGELYKQIEDKVQLEDVKIIAKSMINNYKREYLLAEKLLINKIDDFSEETKRRLKPELILAKSYKYLENYQEAKKQLIAFEKHSKGNVLCHREIAYLEYTFQNHAKAAAQFNKGYPQGITTMPLDDFVKYVECMYFEKQYESICELYNAANFKHDILIYYYLTSLHKQSLFREYIQETNKIGKLNVSVEKRNMLLLMKIQALRESGYIVEAKELIDQSISMDNLNYLITIAEVYELSNEFKKANDIWKLILKKFNKEMPSYSWDRYYKTLLCLDANDR